MNKKVKDALQYHEFPAPGKLSVNSTKPCETADDLALAYTPGVAEPVLAIAKDPSNAYRYTNKGNLVAVITDGSAVLGLGNVGALAGKPVILYITERVATKISIVCVGCMKLMYEDVIQ